MRRLGLVVGLVLALFGFASSAQAATTIDFSNAPQGTHFVTGTPEPSCTVTGLVVSCNSYELAGVGNTNAEATLVATFTATVQCRNNGGQIVEVKSQVVGAESSTGQLEPKNGRLAVPALTSAPAPSDDQFTAQAVCPNRNWTKEVLAGSQQVSGFTYELTFAGFDAPAISITQP